MNSRKIRGFTLIEILTVITIIIILIGLLSPALRRAREQANEQKARAMVASLEVAINMYYTDQGSYPSATGWGKALAEKSGNYGPYMDNKDYDGTDFNDPWGNAYNYNTANPSHNTATFDIWSNGPDKQNDNGTDDDIGNW